ncbi:LysM peptidoglycan-binding domain-containing protein [Paenibacillus sp. KN14-4R]|uniref:LysM peptidoglycan-binding domain-containing protein n=1 Tax=Paenibacillus sp. KN14-4R TaxID=3445773 RepID=UPI003F9F5DFA
MKKKIKMLGAAVLLATMVPISANAADVGTASKTPSVHKEDAGVNHRMHDKRGDNIGFSSKDIQEELVKLLKLDAKTLKSKLAQGETLKQIAEQQGVSQDDLKKALIDANNQMLEKAKSKFANSVDKIISEKHPNKEAHKSAIHMNSTEIAKLLGLSEADLKQALKSGKSLADLAKEKNVDVQKLIDVQVTALMKNVEKQVQDGKITKEQADKRKASFTQMVTKMMDGKGNKELHNLKK